MKSLKLLFSLLLFSVTTLTAMAQEYAEKPKIKILNFEKVQNIHYNLAQEFARKTPNTNRDSVIWALLIVETNDPNIRVVSSEEIGFYLTEKLRENPRLDINNFRLPGQKWYSMRPGANKFRITHDRFRHDVELPELFNSERKHIGRIEKNWFIPISSIFGSTRQAEACTVYRLRIEVPQDYPDLENETDSKNKIINTTNINDSILTPKWAPEVTLAQMRVLTELINSMTKVEGGTFWMGAQSTDPNGHNYDPDAKMNDIVQQVTLNKYLIGKCEVTQEQWEIVMGSNPSAIKSISNPVSGVSWDDCIKFINKINKLTGLKFSLPTEAQWEFAARGGNKSKGYKYSGSNNIDSVAWFMHFNNYDNKGNSGGLYCPICQKGANELGLYDMSGNVKEWCSDTWVLNDNKRYRGFRGGSMLSQAKECKVSSKNSLLKEIGVIDIGFRLVVNIEAAIEQKSVLKASVITPNWDPKVSKKQKLILTELINSMTFVEGGAFGMGAQNIEPKDRNYDKDAWYFESPVHQVKLSDYHIGKYEVTQEEWEAVMGNNPSQFKGSKKPVEQVSWSDCQEFINRLKAITGLNFALPTEAQWEYAARGGNKSKGYKYSGSNNIDSVAWFGNLNIYGDKKGNGGSETHLVGQKYPNELGIYDMSGNVWEWCSDVWYSYDLRSVTDPKHDAHQNKRHIIRGSSWSDNARRCRVSYRGNSMSDDNGNYLGLRLVINP